MRITPEILLKIANDTVTRRVRGERDLLAVYLTGSLLDPDPLLAGTTDIDLCFIHHQSMPPQREMTKLTNDVHLDIVHVSRDRYRQPRNIRNDPWLGAEVFNYRPLYDPQHFLDFTQASVRSMFDRPETVLLRARSLLEAARQDWLSLQMDAGELDPQTMRRYLQVIEQASNSIACLSGAPLTERRFLLRFGERAAAVGRPGLTAGLLGLLGAPQASAEMLRSWVGDWRQGLLAVPQRPGSELHAMRLEYYLRPVESWLENESTAPLALWLLLRTWTAAACELLDEIPLQLPWKAAVEQLGLAGPAFGDKLTAQDAYLDLVEETLEIWARKAGA